MRAQCVHVWGGEGGEGGKGASMPFKTAQNVCGCNVPNAGPRVRGPDFLGVQLGSREQNQPDPGRSDFGGGPGRPLKGTKKRQDYPDIASSWLEKDDPNSNLAQAPHHTESRSMPCGCSTWSA
eukprot:scaffold80539_cov17-Tisochrysis_lutea.AAC.1